MTRKLLAGPDVAEKLGYGMEWWYRHSRRLMAQEGFPKPVLGRARGARWDPVAIDAWFDRRGSLAAASTVPDSEDEDPWAKLLDGRAAAFAGGRP